MKHSLIPTPCVALVTDRSVRGSINALLQAVEAAVAGGVSLVQLREKDLPDAELLSLAKRLRTLAGDRVLLFVNDNVSVAQAAGADGVQLGEWSRTVTAARAAMGPLPLRIGRSVHDVAGARGADEQGADFVVVGAVFETASHPCQVPAGVGLVQEVAHAVVVPVLGIGGITAANAGQVIEAGASGVAVIRDVLAADDPEAAAHALCDAVAVAWATRSDD